MTATPYRREMSWSTKLLLALTLIIVGAAAATLGLARYDKAARLLGVAPPPAAAPAPRVPALQLAIPQPAPSDGRPHRRARGAAGPGGECDAARAGSAGAPTPCW